MIELYLHFSMLLHGALLVKPLVKVTLLTAVEVCSNGNISDLYSGSPGFEFSAKTPNILTQIFRYLPQSLRQIPRMMPQLGYHR
jgi:hypothetical protein